VRAGSQRLCGIVLLTMLFAVTSYADSFTFETIPADGNVSAAAGETVGWGYKVTNSSDGQWLMFTILSADSFTNGTANSFIFDFPIVAPGGNIQPYDAVAGTGLFEFTWDADAPAGWTNSGNFVLIAELWNGDPFIDGVFTDATVEFVVPYSVSVPLSCNCTPEPVPEPSSSALLACGLGLLFLLHRRRKLPLGL